MKQNKFLHNVIIKPICDKDDTYFDYVAYFGTEDIATVDEMTSLWNSVYDHKDFDRLGRVLLLPDMCHVTYSGSVIPSADKRHIIVYVDAGNTNNPEKREDILTEISTYIDNYNVQYEPEYDAVIVSI